MEELESLFESHRQTCNTCDQLNNETQQCKLSRCNCTAWKRPRCPVSKWTDKEYNQICAELSIRLQPQQL